MSWPVPLRKQLERLPRTSATWQIAMPAAQLLMADDVPGSICLCLQGDGMVRATKVIQGVPTAADWTLLLKNALAAPQKPLRPTLPGRLQLQDPQLAAVLTPFAEALKIKVEICAELPVLAEFASGLTEQFAQGGRTIIADLERDLFAASAAYARAEPWTLFCEEPHFQLDTEVLGWPEPVAVVMGGMGQTFGLAVYASAEVLDDCHYASDAGGPEAVARISDCVSVTLESSRSIPSNERKRVAARQYDVVPGRFPLFTRMKPGRKPADLHTPDQYQVLTLALRALTAWAERLLEDAARPGPERTADELVLDDGRVRCVLVNPESAGFFEADEDDSEQE